MWRLARTRVLWRLAVSLVVSQRPVSANLENYATTQNKHKKLSFLLPGRSLRKPRQQRLHPLFSDPKNQKNPAPAIEKNWFRFKRLPRRLRKLPRSLLKLQEDSWTLLGSFQEASGSFLRRSMKLPRRSRKLSKRLSLRPSVYRPTAFRLRPGAALVCKISGQ